VIEPEDVAEPHGLVLRDQERQLVVLALKLVDEVVQQGVENLLLG
jgi:hypothetical protein